MPSAWGHIILFLALARALNKRDHLGFPTLFCLCLSLLGASVPLKDEKYSTSCNAVTSSFNDLTQGKELWTSELNWVAHLYTLFPMVKLQDCVACKAWESWTDHSSRNGSQNQCYRITNHQSCGSQGELCCCKTRDVKLTEPCRMSFPNAAENVHHICEINELRLVSRRTHGWGGPHEYVLIQVIKIHCMMKSNLVKFFIDDWWLILASFHYSKNKYKKERYKV